MSTENDPTAPVPTTGPEAPTAPVRRSTTGGLAAEVTGDQPTTPVPRTPARHTDDPTLTLRTAGEAATGGTSTAPDARPADAGPARSAEPVTTRTDTTGDVGARTGRPPVRVGTVVWGLVLAVIGAGIIAVAAGAVIDVELALITLLALAGLGLVVGSVATGVRRRH